ncbi:hypothetical protein AAMO2058_000628700 [Amorphochlora amoebiformis]
MNIQYLSGKVAGRMVYENIHLGDVSVRSQAVGLANVVDIELMDDVVWDGILGLAYPNPSLTKQGIIPLFDTIIKEKALTKRGLANQFAYYIDDTKGVVTLGGANCDLITSPGSPKSTCVSQFHFVPISEKTYWTIDIADVRVQYPNEPERSGFCPVRGCKAIVDTGTYLIYGPQNQVNHMISSSMPSCRDHVTMPRVTFDFKVNPGDDPVTVTLNPIDYILKFESDNREDCVVGISPDKDTIWTLGQVFLRSFYTIFDRDDNRIGFARIPRKAFAAVNHAESSHADIASYTPEIEGRNINKTYFSTPLGASPGMYYEDRQEESLLLQLGTGKRLKGIRSKVRTRVAASNHTERSRVL